MDERVMERVQKAAARVRQWAEDNAARVTVFPSDLTGLCAISSMRLYTNLRRARLHHHADIKLGYNRQHCFVLVDDWVVDVTATQFGRKSYKPVTIEPHTNVFPWKVVRKFDSAAELRKFLYAHKWPEYQVELKHAEDIDAYYGDEE